MVVLADGTILDVKQALLRQLYGDAGIEEMRAVKRALDPGWKLSPGVILGAQP